MSSYRPNFGDLVRFGHFLAEQVTIFRTNTVPLKGVVDQS